MLHPGGQEKLKYLLVRGYGWRDDKGAIIRYVLPAYYAPVVQVFYLFSSVLNMDKALFCGVSQRKNEGMKSEWQYYVVVDVKYAQLTKS